MGAPTIYQGVVATGGGIRIVLYAPPPTLGARLFLTPLLGGIHDETAPVASGCEETARGDSAHMADIELCKMDGDILQVGTSLQPGGGRDLVTGNAYKKLNEGPALSRNLRHIKRQSHATLPEESGVTALAAGARDTLLSRREGRGSRKTECLSPRIPGLAGNKKPKLPVTGYRSKTHQPFWAADVQRHWWNPMIGMVWYPQGYLLSGLRCFVVKEKADVSYRTRGKESVSPVHFAFACVQMGKRSGWLVGVELIWAGVPERRSSVRNFRSRSHSDVFTVQYWGATREMSPEDVSGTGVSGFDAGYQGRYTQTIGRSTSTFEAVN
jgi:hypothetical protein